MLRGKFKFWILELSGIFLKYFWSAVGWICSYGTHRDRGPMVQDSVPSAMEYTKFDPKLDNPLAKQWFVRFLLSRVRIKRHSL